MEVMFCNIVVVVDVNSVVVDVATEVPDVKAVVVLNKTVAVSQ